MIAPSANPLVWLALFVSLSIGTIFASSRHLLDAPRQAAARVVAPLQTGASRVGHALGDLASGWEELNRLRAENAALRRTVDELVQQNVALRAAELENRELRDQLHFARQHPDESLVPAEVIGFDSSTLLGNAVINRGRDDQLKPGMTIVSSAGLVGRITALTAHTSTVLLITHPSSSVNAVIQGSPGATGLVNGQPDGRLLLRYVPQGEPMKVNDIVVTSGLGGAFPRNLPIGRVVEVRTRDVDMFQEAVVEPFVNFRRLSLVMVATGFVPPDQQAPGK